MISVSTTPDPHESRHRPVMLRETIRALELEPGLVVVDGTVGAGGHSREILPRIAPHGQLIGLDRDPMMLAFAGDWLGSPPNYHSRHTSYTGLKTVLDELSLTSADRVLLDLGLSSDQLADESRGFSFHADGPLDLRFDTSAGVPASELLASRSADELGSLFKDYGEEPHAAAIAKRIKSRSTNAATLTGRELGELIAEVAGRSGKRGGSHPATRVFQALRIAVNRELDELHRMLHEILPACLSPGGRAVIITFHSLEDRMVKTAFRDRDVWSDVVKPIKPTPSEERINPRARSAQIRVATRRVATA